MIEKFRYCEIVRGSPFNRGNVIELTDGTNRNIDYFGDTIVDCYHSAFMHCEQYQTYTDSNGGKSGYDGPVISDCLYFDMDSEDLNVSLSSTKELLTRIRNLNIPDGNIYIYFSGNKGFHVIVYLKELSAITVNANIIVKNMCNLIAEDLVGFDSKIYDKTRIIRSPNSLHSKSGLYKIELDVKQFAEYNIQDIINQAKAQVPAKDRELSHEYNDNIANLLDQTAKVQPDDKYESNFTVRELESGIIHGFTKGRRNSGLTSVAGLLHRRNISQNIISAILHSINSHSSDALSGKEIDTIVRSVNRYSVDSSFIDPKESEVLTFQDAARNYINMRKRVDRMDFGFPELNNQLPFFDPGEVFLICARAGVGKTNLGMQLCRNIASHCNGNGLFTSLEMPSHSVFLRAACIDLNSENQQLTTLEVSDALINEDKLVQKIVDKWNTIYIVDKDCLSIEQIENYFHLTNDKCGHSLEVLLIDYGGLIQGGDNYDGISKIARGMKRLSKKLHTRVISIVQLSRAAGDGTIPVKMDMLRDSGAWEEGADYVYGGWFSKNDGNRIHMSALKNRWMERSSGDGGKFDIINHGLYYLSEPYQRDKIEW